MKKFPSFRQLDEKDCGPACLKIILKYHGKNVSLEQLVDDSETTRTGSSMLGLSNAAEKWKLKSLGAKTTLDVLEKEVLLPCIVYWQQKHFVVVYKMKNDKIFVSDPAHGLLIYSKNEFVQNWIGNNADLNSEGVILLLEPQADFLDNELEEGKDVEVNLSFLGKYLKSYKPLIVQLFFSLIAASLIQLSFPFLTQAIVDVGIQNQDLNFIYLILLAQLILFVGKISLEVIRSWILLNISSRIKISLISDFFIKLMNLPISFFDVKVTGDIIQRINDNKRIQSFLTVTSLNVLFSIITLVIFGAVLLYYSLAIFGIFAAGAVIYFFWISFFQSQRKILDYKLFSHLSNEQTKIIELIQGMQEIKLHNAERQKRWSWEYIQARIFKIELKNLSLEQYQTVGASFINELKNILVTVLAAKLVIEGNLTLGMMLSISYIIGQLNGPLIQMVEFFHSTQNAKISLERLVEITRRENEETSTETNIKEIENEVSITFSNVAFSYKGANGIVLKDLNFSIPANKVTAIVGPSGYGKTTILKLLLKIYDPTVGDIRIENTDLKTISPGFWRSQCGVVMQEGFIFNDTIANNIALGESQVDKGKLHYASDIANLKEFVDDLPLGYNTKIGADGVGISMGQKQRILIARAVYKNPKFIFLDEATSALDANNEKIVMNNLNDFFRSRTVIVIAHRLSTVKNADQIIVLTKNGIAEIGNHENLLKSKGPYFNLVKNQLQLDQLS